MRNIQKPIGRSQMRIEESWCYTLRRSLQVNVLWNTVEIGRTLIPFNTDSAFLVGYMVVWLVFFVAFCSFLVCWLLGSLVGLVFIIGLFVSYLDLSFISVELLKGRKLVLFLPSVLIPGQYPLWPSTKAEAL